MKARITKLESKQDTTTVHLSWSGDDATVHDFDLDALGTKARVPSPAGGDLRSGWVVLEGPCRLSVGDLIDDTREAWAIVGEDLSGPALGVGPTEDDAWADAAKWGTRDQGGVRAVRITRESYDRVQSGNPDAIEMLR